MQYRSDQHFIYLNGFLPPDLVDILDAVKTKNGWRLPKNLHVYRELYKMIPELRSNAEFVSDGKRSAKEREYWLALKKERSMSFPELRPYQNQDAYYLIQRGSCLVLNEPRTGKTPTMIKVLSALGKRRNIVICPSSLVFNWAKEFQRWAEGVFDVYVASGTPTKRLAIMEEYKENSRKTPSVLIISKDTWKTVHESWEDVEFDVAVVDEAHFLRNYKTVQSKAIFKLKAKVKYALTGTPAVKHAVDVYGLLRFINPEAFPSYWQFAERYFVFRKDMWGKRIGEPKEHRKEELKTIMELNSVQRKREDVMKWLPRKNHQTLYVKMEGKQMKLYEQMLETFVASDGDNEVNTMNKLAQLIRLRQLCLDPRLLGFDVVGAKTKALLEFAENQKEPFIVMTTFSSYFDIIKPELEKLGKRVGVIGGTLTQKKKFEVADDFQRGRYDVLLCNIIAAGTGFTLDRADTVVFVDKSYNPADNEQAQDRIVPTSEDRYHPIHIISLVCAGSIDERVNEIIENKEDITKIINNPEEFLNVR